MKFDIEIRFWKVSFHCFYNKSLKQLQIQFGKRFFEGSTDYSKAFLVIKRNGKDVIVSGARSSSKEFEIQRAKRK